MKLNRKWILVMSLVLSVAMATTGTLAYLTDRDSEANVFAIGNVSIDLTEDFQQGADLIPGVKIEKMPVITNTSKTNDAWVWMIWSIPAALDSNAELGTENIVHYNWFGGTSESHYNKKNGAGEWYLDTFKKAIADNADLLAKLDLPESIDEVAEKKTYWSVDEHIGTKTVDGIEYNCYAYKYHKALTPGETTLPTIHTVYLDTHVDIDPDGNMYYVHAGEATDLNWNINTQGAPTIFVNAYAMQKDTFDNVDAAFDAYTDQWTSTGEDTDAIEFAKPATLVSTADELSAALDAGENVALTADIEKTPDLTTPYDREEEPVKTAYKQNGGTLDGAGNTLDMGEPDNGDNYGIMTSSGTIKNVTIQNSDRAIMIMSPTKDVVIENVTIKDNVMYPINTGEKGSDNVKLVVKDSVLGGWTSFSNIESASFTNCTFKQGTYYKDIYGRVLKPYVTTVIKNCSFDKAYNLDLSRLGADCTVTIENCTVNGVELTADVCTINPSDYDNCTFSIDLPSGRTLADCVIFK